MVLRIEAYPCVTGLMVRLVGVDHSEIPSGEGVRGLSAMTVVGTPYIEQVGVDLAVHYGIRGLLEAYPEICEYALR